MKKQPLTEKQKQRRYRVRQVGPLDRLYRDWLAHLDRAEKIPPEKNQK